mmetsp:Transcript_7263/g.13553  ORF Transcript_7263/g.13553 Transcript_7263/m.13553 type:complete len:219 (+) Transcript_7263:1393-2049(+)
MVAPTVSPKTPARAKMQTLRPPTAVRKSWPMSRRTTSSLGKAALARVQSSLQVHLQRRHRRKSRPRRATTEAEPSRSSRNSTRSSATRQKSYRDSASVRARTLKSRSVAVPVLTGKRRESQQAQATVWTRLDPPERPSPNSTCSKADGEIWLRSRSGTPGRRPTRWKSLMEAFVSMAAKSRVETASKKKETTATTTATVAASQTRPGSEGLERKHHLH